MPLIIGSQSATAAGGYEIANSCRFNGVNGYLTRTNPGTSPTLATKGTLSWWMKRTGEMRSYLEGYTIYTHGAVAPYFQLAFNSLSTDCPAKLTLENHDNGVSNCKFVTSEAYGDGSAWYHFVFSYDSTPATPSSTSVKTFVNGVQVTAFDTEVYPVQNDVFELTVASSNYPIGNITTRYLQAYMAEIIQVDGQALDADSFGEFNSDSPTIWQPIDVSSITVGNNGFYLDFSDGANLGTLASGTGDFTETNIDATDQATDTPTNNFATFNALQNYYPASTFKDGNGTIETSSSSIYTPNTSTFAMSTGKWYCEFETGTGAAIFVGITDKVGLWTTGTQELGDGVNEWGFYMPSGDLRNNNVSVSYGSGWSHGDVVQIALDLDNNNLYFGVDNSWENSGVPTSGATGTGAISITAPASTSNGEYFFAISNWEAPVGTINANFGGCSAFTLTSAESDGNDYGNFEYAPPSGYLALCTKNLATDGG